MIDNLASEYTTHNTASENAYDSWGTAEENRINDHYDDVLEERKQELIANGLYNTTTWSAVSTGVERERTDSLTELAQKQITLQDGLRDRLYKLQLEMRQRLIDARMRLEGQLKSQLDARLTVRNRVVEAICNFAERRSDTYPDISEIGKIVNSLGANNPAGFIP